MKIAWKIFCMAYFVVLLTVGSGGFALVEFASSSVIDSKIESVLNSNLYSAKLFLALSEQNTAALFSSSEISRQAAQMSNSDGTSKLAICQLSETTAYGESSFANELKDSEQGYTFIDIDSNKSMQAICRIDLSGKKYYIETVSDFSQVFLQRDALVNGYIYALIAISLLSGAILLCFSLYIAHPLKKLSLAANQIAEGGYEKRIPIGSRGMGSYEVRKLAESFNTMAQSIEAKINELKDEIDTRELFIADFTHELKTPMTSVIGYADMLRSYDLDERERREIADTIYREGKRLENLSMELIDIIVLKNAEIPLLPVNAVLLFENLEKSLKFLSEKYNIKTEISAEKCFVRAERSLMLSLLYNLADNACKASSKGETVSITGVIRDKRYLISVKDNGCGIPEENLEKITDAFYMVDKSRSRSQGGAGLGLALCKRIAQLHNSELEFSSKVGAGTAVSFYLDIFEDKASEEENI